jgi:hypothetical protein
MEVLSGVAGNRRIVARQPGRPCGRWLTEVTFDATGKQTLASQDDRLATGPGHVPLACRATALA